MKDLFLNYITQRGFYNQCTNLNGLEETLNKNTVAYAGFDCTADSLHIGSLVPIMLLRAYQRHGHKPIILLGGGTTLIGDPSGKEETRKILTTEQINSNKEKLRKLFGKFLSFDKSENGAVLVDNIDWIKNLNFVSFIRDIGSMFSVNRMLSFESVKQRLNRQQNLSFLEFNYSILQAYDFLELNNSYNCQLQFGGSDQWGNIVSGIDLVKRKKNKELFGLTTPLIMTAEGNKMGKTASGAIWLTSDKLSPYEYWQFWRNVSDKDVLRFLKLFTELPIKEIQKYESYSGSELNEAKVILANEATKICHGEEASKSSELSSTKIFNDNSLDDSIPEKHILKINKKEIEKGTYLKEVLLKIFLSNSIGESKRLISNGGVKINDVKILDKEHLITINDFNQTNFCKITIGKKRHGMIEVIK